MFAIALTSSRWVHVPRHRRLRHCSGQLQSEVMCMYMTSCTPLLWHHQGEFTYQDTTVYAIAPVNSKVRSCVGKSRHVRHCSDIMNLNSRTKTPPSTTLFLTTPKWGHVYLSHVIYAIALTSLKWVQELRHRRLRQYSCQLQSEVMCR